MEKKLSRQEREKIEIERTILQHAEDLLRLNGYENTTMDMLAKSCEYTKRTIYRYFTCKEDLYFAVLLKEHILLLETVKSIAQGNKTGKEKILSVTQALCNLYKESEYVFDLMGQIKAIRSHKQPDELPFYQKYTDCVGAIHKEVILFFIMANKDNSIRTDIDPAMLGYASIFITNGFFHMLSMAGDSFIRYFSSDTEQYDEFSKCLSIDAEQFIQFTMKLMSEVLDGEKR